MAMAMLASFNYYAIATATAVFFILGALWFSPLMFGNLWAEELRKKNVLIPHPTTMHMIRSMLLSLSSKIVAAYCMAYLVAATGAQTLHAGLMLGFIVAIGFNIMSIASICIWENRSLKLFFISSGYATIGVMMLGAILAVWR